MGTETKISGRRACALVGIKRLTFRYQLKARDDSALRERLKALAERWRRFGYRRLGVMLEREAIVANHKKIFRVYTEEGLKVRRKRKKNRSEVHSVPMLAPSLRDARVVRVLERLAVTRGLPKTIVMDNGSEFTGQALDAWANKAGVKLHFIDPGKPMRNCHVESFNGKFRDKCLDMNWFTDLADARRTIEEWRVEYNEVRPPNSLKNATPTAFATGVKEQKPTANPLLQLV